MYITAAVPTWNNHAATTHTFRHRPPSNATGAASSTNTAATAIGGKSHAWPTIQAPMAE